MSNVEERFFSGEEHYNNYVINVESNFNKSTTSGTNACLSGAIILHKSFS